MLLLSPPKLNGSAMFLLLYSIFIFPFSVSAGPGDHELLHNVHQDRQWFHKFIAPGNHQTRADYILHYPRLIVKLLVAWSLWAVGPPAHFRIILKWPRCQPRCLTDRWSSVLDTRSNSIGYCSNRLNSITAVWALLLDLGSSSGDWVCNKLKVNRLHFLFSFQINVGSLNHKKCFLHIAIYLIRWITIIYNPIDYWCQ